MRSASWNGRRRTGSGWLPAPGRPVSPSDEVTDSVSRRAEPDGRAGAAPFAVSRLATKAGTEIVCGDGHAVRILERQEADRKRMAAGAWQTGFPLQTK